MTMGDQGDAESRAMKDRIEVRGLVDAWAYRRDTGDWAGLLDLWHPDGTMVSTWRQSSAADFVAGCKAASDKGIEVQHLMAGGSVVIRGERAIAETRMVINQRAEIDGVLLDAECFGWMVDFIERRDGPWRMVHRQPVYERDRLVPATPGVFPVIDQELLGSFPDGYRHLAYLQTKLGMTVAGQLPGLHGPERDKLRQRVAVWLANETGA